MKPTPYFLGALAAVFAFGLFFASCAHADDTLTWKHPTQYVDPDTTDTVPSEALNAADIQATIIRVYATAASTAVLSTVRVERAATDDPNLPPPTTVTIPRESVVLVQTQQCYEASTLMKATAGGDESAPSSRVCKLVNPPPPKKPKRPTGVVVS